MTSSKHNPVHNGRNKNRRKKFIIATEGKLTERKYFRWFKKFRTISYRLVGKNNKSAPKYVLKSMQNFLKKEYMNPHDEAWIVIDKDKWTDSQLKPLYEWAKNPKCNLALSNPKFELWLLLHYEDGNGVTSAHECDRRLKKYCPGYKKDINETDITFENIHKAIKRARKHEKNADDKLSNPGITTVYKLVERMLREIR